MENNSILQPCRTPTVEVLFRFVGWVRLAARGAELDARRAVVFARGCSWVRGGRIYSHKFARHSRFCNNTEDFEASVMDELNESLNELALKQLECPICLDYCSPPIVQCVNGHTICAKCRPRITACGVCKGGMTNVRNLFAEQMCPRIKFPCKFASNGCTLKIELSKMDDHLIVCSFVIHCQLKVQSAKKPTWYVPCLWLGSHFELIDHVKKLHSPRFSGNSEASHEFPLRHKVDVRLVLSKHQLFWSVLMYDFKTYTMRGMVFCIASKEKAKHYEFKYDVMSKNGQYVIVHQGNVVSSHEVKSDLKEYFQNEGCATDTEDSTLLCQGQATMRLIINDGIFKCKLLIISK